MLVATMGETRDTQQFDAFVRDHGDRLLRTAYGLCGDWQHAEDLVQQVLVTVARRWSGIATSPTAYAYRSLVRANIDRWRVTRRRPELISAPAALPEPAGTEPAPVEDHLVVLEALRGLPPRQRAIVVLRYLDDFTEARTAEVLGISVGAVKSGAHRGLDRLRKAMITSEGDSR